MKKAALPVLLLVIANSFAMAEDHPGLSEGDIAYSAERYAEAAALYRKDAEIGVVAAQLNLAYLYQDGMGVEQSAKEAAAWFGRAAEQGSAEAQQALGVHYRDGQGVQQDRVEAYKWLTLAGAKNDADALAKQLTHEQLGDATKRIDAWRNGHPAQAKR